MEIQLFIIELFWPLLEEIILKKQKVSQNGQEGWPDHDLISMQILIPAGVVDCQLPSK